MDKSKALKPLPYYKWFWQDFRANRTVQRMTYVERGLYRELLDECWADGSIPPDVESLADICGCPVDVMASAWQVLGKCFTLIDGRLYNEKLHSLRTEKDSERVRKHDAGRVGGIRKSMNTKGNVALASNCLATSSNTHIEEKRREEKRERRSKAYAADNAPATNNRRGARLALDWRLPDDWRQDAIATGLAGGSIDLESAKFRDYWTAKAGQSAVKIDWRATWRNWCRTAAQRQPQKSKHDLTGIDYTRGVSADGKF